MRPPECHRQHWTPAAGGQLAHDRYAATSHHQSPVARMGSGLWIPRAGVYYSRVQRTGLTALGWSHGSGGQNGRPANPGRPSQRGGDGPLLTAMSFSTAWPVRSKSEPPDDRCLMQHRGRLTATRHPFWHPAFAPRRYNSAARSTWGRSLCIPRSRPDDSACSRHPDTTHIPSDCHS
ncbi:hypothetical protein P154DRAFT_101048 [Amniculicola lignicola CBS 123094]|uniref:Uncharacterized protein n=1 Tax=Amniculicola lignicola CBS 123094 TaxID=1392246 RepID=A0A6A5WSU3_9PLEO|nr:hypothetical protein P154DRAFT_101048 [Amniculicola lignicola CBS 123094]